MTAYDPQRNVDEVYSSDRDEPSLDQSGLSTAARCHLTPNSDGPSKYDLYEHSLKHDSDRDKACTLGHILFCGPEIAQFHFETTVDVFLSCQDHDVRYTGIQIILQHTPQSAIQNNLRTECISEGLREPEHMGVRNSCINGVVNSLYPNMTSTDLPQIQPDSRFISSALTAIEHFPEDDQNLSAIISRCCEVNGLGNNLDQLCHIARDTTVNHTTRLHLLQAAIGHVNIDQSSTLADSLLAATIEPLSSQECDEFDPRQALSGFRYELHSLIRQFDRIGFDSSLIRSGLTEAIVDPKLKTEQQFSAIQALSKLPLGPDHAHLPLVYLTKSRSASIRMASLQALSHATNEREKVIELLHEGLHDDDPIVRIAAVRGLPVVYERKLPLEEQRIVASMFGYTETDLVRLAAQVLQTYGTREIIPELKQWTTSGLSEKTVFVDTIKAIEKRHPAGVRHSLSKTLGRLGVNLISRFFNRYL